MTHAAAPIGVFDSGLGGLTAVKQLRALLPHEHIVYFGDTGRVPYGSRGRETIIAYARQDIAFLLSRRVKTILAACGTVSTTFPPEQAAALPVGYMGVVEAAAAAAAAATRTGRVGIIGTEASMQSGSYQRALAAQNPGIQTVANACPLFVPLVENGHFAPDDTMAALAAEKYLAPVRQAGVDTLILGCTHYPLLAGVISAQMGPDVTLIDPGREAALRLKEQLAAQNLLASATTQPLTEYFVSDAPDRFEHLARLFLGGETGGSVQQINIEQYHLGQMQNTL